MVNDHFCMAFQDVRSFNKRKLPYLDNPASAALNIQCALPAAAPRLLTLRRVCHSCSSGSPLPHCCLHPLHTCFIHLSPAKHQPLPPLRHHPVQHAQMQMHVCFQLAPKRCTNNTPPLRPAAVMLVLAPAAARRTSLIAIPATRFKQSAMNHAAAGGRSTICAAAISPST